MAGFSASQVEEALRRGPHKAARLTAEAGIWNLADPRAKGELFLSGSPAVHLANKKILAGSSFFSSPHLPDTLNSALDNQANLTIDFGCLILKGSVQDCSL